MTTTISTTSLTERNFHWITASEQQKLDGMGRLPANVRAWINHQEQRGFAAKTLQRRVGTMLSLLAYVAPVALEAVGPELIQEWLATFSAPRTRHHYLSDVSLWFRWAVARDLVAANPCDRVDGPRLHRAYPRPLTSDQVGLAIATSRGRMRTAIMLAAYAGLRVAEIAALQSEDVSLVSPPSLVVRNGKGGRDRVIPLHPALAEELAKYTVHGRVCAGTPNGWSHQIGDHLKRIGINAGAHALRHSFGTELARACSGDLLLCAELLGHSQPQTSMIYCQLTGTHGSAAVQRMYAT